MKNLNTFQLVLIGGLIFLGIVGVLVFSGILPGFRDGINNNKALVNLTLWGTFPADKLRIPIDNFNELYDKSFRLTYVAKRDQKTLENDFVNELASGRGPDLIIMAPEMIWNQRERLHMIPYKVFPQRDFIDAFIDAGKIYLNQEAIIALPLVVDPLVMYFNRDLVRGQGIAEPPKNWTKIIETIPSFFSRDVNQNILRTSIALGEFGNIDHAKEIFAMLLLQAENPIMNWGADSKPQVFINDVKFGGPESASLVLNFFNQFSDPAKTSYTWNSAMPRSRDYFSQGLSAFYLGLASENPIIKAKNPHLNFDVAIVPQKNEIRRSTYGKLFGVAVSRSAKSPNDALAVARAVTLGNFAKDLATSLAIAPVRLDLLGAPPTNNTATPIFYKSAVISSTWLDINPPATLNIFSQNLIKLKTGQVNLRDTVAKIGTELNALIQN